MNETPEKNIVHADSVGRTRFEIEEREGQHGVFYSTRFFRIWNKDQEEIRVYGFTTSERADDLQDLAKASAEASNWIRLQLERASAA